MKDSDAFERAARREQIEQIRRERMMKEMRRHAIHGGESAGKSLAVFFLPYLLWALLRAPNHVWGEPDTARSIVRFFFDSGTAFAVFTGFMLFLVWVWMIKRAGGDDDDDD